LSLKVDYRFESGAVIQTVIPAFRELDAILPAFDDTRYPYLRLVDRYGDTIFSLQQMVAVLPELKMLRSESPEAGSVLDTIIELAEKCSKEPHAFLVFIGD
jgi:hypothetical protein